MKYTPCTDSSKYASRFYCGYNESCFIRLKTDARLKETYDSRDGTTCFVTANNCPC